VFKPKPDLSIKIIQDLHPVPIIKCKPTELNQVFMTILVNASEAISEKGEITITTFADNQYIHVKISDSGKGIAEDHLKKIFEIGFSTKDAKVKFHVGLANSYNIIQQHGGDIHATSELGKGSEFWIKLPLGIRNISLQE
jgi:signal transduction histidine kinase